MNLWEPLVETTRSRPLVSTLGSTHKVAKHLLPVNFGGQTLLDGLPHSRGHRAPRTSLVGFFCCLADRLLDALLGDLVGLCVTTALAETLVDIEVVVFAKRRAFAVLLRLFFHLFQLSEIPLVSLVGRKMGKLALTGQTALHWLAALGEHGTGIRLAGQLSRHFGKSVDCEIHRDVVNTTDAAFRLTSGHMLENDVIELVHQNTQLVLVLQSTHELGVVEQLELCAVRVDTDASSRHAVGADLVNPTRQGSEERLAHQQTRRVEVEIKGLVSHALSLLL